jgi:hypothetical protein
MNRTFNALAVFALAGTAAAQITVGPVAHPTTGTRYYRLAPATWANANTLAASFGGTLATIHDAATNEWIRANLAAAGGNTVTCFIGINDVAREGTFRWSNGEKPVYLNWLAGEPNNAGGGEDFGIMIPSSGLWNDIPDGISRPAIIEVTGPIRVPAEYPTIQAAVDAAVDGQTILVARGQHTGNVNYGTKKLVIRSEGGPMSTTIRVLPGSVGISMAGGQGPETVFEGFTVVPSTGSADTLVNALDGQIIRNCRFNNPGARGVRLRGTSVLSDSLVVGCDPGILVTSSGTRTNATVQNCTLVGNNQCLASSDNVPGVSVTVSLINSVTAGNISPFGAGGTSNIFFFSNVVAEGDVGPNNLNADPRFVNAPGSNGIYELTDDYFLQPTSPCIDAANNARRKPLSSLSIPTDLRGGPRFVDDAATFDTGAGPGPVADCGAYEYTAPALLCPVDFNADGFLDFFDYDAFVEAFEFGCAF